MIVAGGQKQGGQITPIRVDDDGNVVANTLSIAGEDIDSYYLATSSSGNYTRIGGVNTVQTIKTAPGIIQRIIVNTGVANATITLRDGPNTDVAVVTLPDTGFRVIEVGAVFGSDIRVVPNNTGLNFTVIWR